MDVLFPEPSRNTQSDQYPLLMEQMHIHNEHEHIIDLTRNDNASSSSSHDEQLSRMDLPPHDNSTRAPVYQTSSSSSNRLNTRNSTVTRRGDGYGLRRRRRSPLNSGLWISTELVITVSQIVASIVVLSMSRNESPEAPLFEWVVGYASGCLATLPILYWRFRNRHQGTGQNSTQSHQGSSQGNPPETTSYTAISIAQASDEENNHATETATNSQNAINFTARLDEFIDHFKMALDCFFAVWFVVGNVWIFGGHVTPTDAPILYRLCLVLLTFSCIGYAMPFILCATICCCLPCIISVLGIREEFSRTRGATTETINALPTYKFNSKKNGNADNQDNNNAGAGEGGVLASGTESERVISGEDAVCCICLARYAENDDLRELSCLHVFHVECVDKWLKINASCPLCKAELGESSSTASPIAQDYGQH